MSAPGQRGQRLFSAALLGVASGAILVPLNSTMLAVALPGVMGDFGLGANQVSSLVTLYLGAVAVALPVGGSIGDRYGHRPAFLTGVLGFAVASALAAIAGSFEVLELSRVGQAVTLEKQRRRLPTHTRQPSTKTTQQSNFAFRNSTERNSKEANSDELSMTTTITSPR